MKQPGSQFPDALNPNHQYTSHTPWKNTPKPGRQVGSQGTLFQGGPRWREDLSGDHLPIEPEHIDYEVGDDPPSVRRGVVQGYGKDFAARSRQVSTEAAGGAVVHLWNYDAPAVLESGAYKSQHLTGTSNGSTNMELRQEAEDFYGLDKPVYGTIGHSERAEDHYGDVQLHLKQSEEHRVTVTDGDSLDQYVATGGQHWGGGWREGYDGQPQDDMEAGRLTDIRRANPQPGWGGMSLDHTNSQPYLEAQIDTNGTGKLDLDSFSRATVPVDSFGIATRQRQDAAAEGFQAAGIPVQRVSRSMQDPLPLKFAQKGSYIQKGYSGDTELPTYDVGNGRTTTSPLRTDQFGKMVESQPDYAKRRAQVERDNPID